MFMCVVFYVCTYISSSREERHLPTTWRINHKSNQINLSPVIVTYEDKNILVQPCGTILSMVQPTGTCRAEVLLETSLSIDYPHSFNKLLRAIKDTQSNVCIRLVESMISELRSEYGSNN